MPLARAETELQAANLALAHLGARLTSLDEDAEAARATKDLFASVRAAALRSHLWNFAGRWATLAQDPNLLPGRFSRAYPLPADCLRVRHVEGLVEDDWQIESSAPAADEAAVVSVLTTEAQAPRIAYTRDVVNVAQWDAQFLDVFALMLAARLAGRLGIADGLPQQLEARALALLPSARRVDQREAARSRVEPVSSFLSVRR